MYAEVLSTASGGWTNISVAAGIQTNMPNQYAYEAFPRMAGFYNPEFVRIAEIRPVYLTNSSSQFSGNFTGNGSGQTNLNSTNLVGNIQKDNLTNAMVTLTNGLATTAYVTDTNITTSKYHHIGRSHIGSNSYL